MTHSEYDIILFSLFRTDHEYSSVSLSWAKEFAKNNRVFYINHPYSLKDIFKNHRNRKLRERLPAIMTKSIRYERLPEIPQNFLAVQPSISYPINWLPNGRIYDYFKRLNDTLIRHSVKKIIRDYNVKKYIYINSYDPYLMGWLPADLGATLSVYQCIDDISQDPYSARHGKRLEIEVVKHSDITMVTSTRLKELLQPHHSNVHVVHNAADTALFEKAWRESLPVPPELQGITKKVIGFTGNLDPLRIDYVLLRKVAEFHHDKILLLVGPVNSDEFYESGLSRMKNVIRTGSKPLAALPAYLQRMDCCLIPFQRNTLTESIYPLKINEYLAAGKPVVSTNFSKDIRAFRDVIDLADHSDQFLQLIDYALFKSDRSLLERRVAVAKNNSWEARVSQFWNIVDDTLAKVQDPELAMERLKIS